MPAPVPTTWRLNVLLLAGMLAVLPACQQPAQRKFVVSTDAPSRTGLLEVNGTVVLGTEGGRLLRVSLNGDVLWAHALDREIAARPAASAGMVVAASVTGEWLGVSLGDGKVRWRAANRTAPASALGSDGTRIYALTVPGEVLAIDPATGKATWTTHLPMGPRTRPGPAPEASGEWMIVLTDKEVLALSRAEGRIGWRAPSLNGTALAVNADRLYVLGATGELTARSAADGQLLWTREGSARGVGALVYGQGSLWLGVEGNHLLRLSPDDGSELWRAPMPGPVVGPIAWAAGLLLVPTAGLEGRLLALSPPKREALFEVRLDSPLRSGPVVKDERVLVLAADGRLVGMDLHPKTAR